MTITDSKTTSQANLPLCLPLGEAKRRVRLAGKSKQSGGFAWLVVVSWGFHIAAVPPYAPLVSHVQWLAHPTLHTE